MPHAKRAYDEHNGFILSRVRIFIAIRSFRVYRFEPLPTCALALQRFFYSYPPFVP